MTGLFVAISMTAGGGAWDNAKKYIENEPPGSSLAAFFIGPSTVGGFTATPRLRGWHNERRNGRY